MRTKETTVYTFDELSDSAKERARNWYRQGMDNDNSFSEFVVSDAIRSHAPQDTELHRIARELQQGAQRTGYTAELTINARERSMTVDCEHYTDMSKATYERLDEAIRDFAHWIYKRLRDEYEYQNSDEAVDESIKANEYEFTEEGERA